MFTELHHTEDDCQLLRASAAQDEERQNVGYLAGAGGKTKNLLQSGARGGGGGFAVFRGWAGVEFSK